MQLSVIICSHNPRADYLQRTLDALKAQTLPKEQWELLLIDNASKEPLASQWDLSWHPHARHIREEELGLTPARLRGIKESAGELLVFVDDDNVLQADYLESALGLAGRFPQIGAFNGGTKGEYETPVSAHLKRYCSDVADFVVAQDYWSNLPTRSIATPIGAGLCVRRKIAADYALKTKVNPLRKILGRSGNLLLSGEDLDLAWCAIDAGMGTARFKALGLIHLMPARRLVEEYIVRLYAGYAASDVILAAIRPNFYPPPVVVKRSVIQSIRFLRSYFRASKIERRILDASRKACDEARRLVETSQTKDGHANQSPIK